MKSKDHLKQYSGALTAAQAADGIQAAGRNAKALFEDADILYRNGRWARATALAILAIEESGKVSILRDLLVAGNAQELRTGWRNYRTHTKKNCQYILLDLIAKGARTLEDLRPIYDEKSEHPDILDALKQVCFYTEACGKCHWSLPDRVVDKDTAKSIIAVAEVLTKGLPGAFSTEAELKIWVKNMAPVWKGSMHELKQALLTCYSEARESGVLQGDPNDFSLTDFILGKRKSGMN